MSIVNIKVNGLDRPLGYDLGTPLLSWQVEGGSKTQKEASIEVYRENETVPLWHCRGDLCWEGTALELDVLLPRTRYRVVLSVTDAADVIHTGETWFETGLMDEPWQAKWIT